MAIYRVIAIHPIGDIWKDGITFTRRQLQLYGERLSNKRLSVNHADLNADNYFSRSKYTRKLPFPANRTMDFRYYLDEDALAGLIHVADEEVIKMIEDGALHHVSVETVRNYLGEIAFLGLALITKEFPPRDARAMIELFRF